MIKIQLGRFWLWWWELPGQRWWFPDPFLGHDMMWDTHDWKSPASWPGIIRCRFRPHVHDSYGGCCYCPAAKSKGGKWDDD